MYTYPNDIVMDPFNGTGTTVLAAKKHGRRYIGIDMDPSYCKYAESRLAASSDIFAD
jgi:DNA modification methylase